MGEKTSFFRAKNLRVNTSVPLSVYHSGEKLVVCQPSASHLQAIWQSPASHLPVVYQLSASHLPVVCQSSASRLPIICQASTSPLLVSYESSASHLQSSSSHEAVIANDPPAPSGGCCVGQMGGR